MSTTLDGMFDLDALIHQAELENAAAWTGAPLNYHTDYYTPLELIAAFDRWVFENGHFGCLPLSHMWHPVDHWRTDTPQTVIGAHQLHVFSADCRCDDVIPAARNHRHEAGSMPNDYMYQAICQTCDWHLIDNNETRVVEAWHDHALPHWRNLPIVPRKLANHQGSDKAIKRLHAWIEEHYPQEMQLPGHPMLTERQSWGTRAVSGRSPWGGYDMSAN